MNTTSNLNSLSRQQVDQRISELLSGIVHALPDMVLTHAPAHTAQSRVAEFRAAFAATRKH